MADEFSIPWTLTGTWASRGEMLQSSCEEQVSGREAGGQARAL